MRSHGLGLAIFLVAAACTACAKGGPPPSVPTQDGSGEPPLHRLLHLTGRALSPSLGTAGEARYTLPLSYPVVDAALN